MDNLTHTLIGVSLANAGLKQRVGRGTTWALAIASNIPDIDVFFGLFLSGDSFLYRRMWTHSVVGLPVLSLIFGYLFHKIFRNLSFKTAFGLFLLGTSLHVLFDLMNSYGVVLLHPFHVRRFELAWVFIIDLAIWGMLLLPLILVIGRRYRPYLQIWSKITLIVLTLYVLSCGGLRWRADSLLRSTASTSNGKVLFTYVFPEALGPHRFRGVVRYPDGYHVYMVYPLTGKIVAHGLELTGESPEVQQIREHPLAKKWLWFFKAPVWQRVNNTDMWEVYDLRFQSRIFNRGKVMSHRFQLHQGQVISLD